jgi:uncharacterized protein (DUF58 family)
VSEQSGHSETVQPRSAWRPSGRLTGLVGLWLVLAVVLKFTPALQAAYPAGLWLGAALLLVVLYDLWLIGRERPDFVIERELTARWPVDSWVRAATRLAHRAGRRLRLQVHELYPGHVRAEGMPQLLELNDREQAEFSWRVRATRRGPMQLDACHVAWASPLGLWWRRQSVVQVDPVRVYPNFNLVLQYGQLAGDRRLSEMGIHQARRRGLGSDFQQLRDYREGDSLRQIDWHATARMHKLIARDYQEERDQRVIFLLDCSRRMRAMDGQLSHFDQCLNAMLLLAHVAIKQGDEIALQTVASPDGRERVLPAGRGRRQFGALLESIFDLEAGTGHPDFLGAAAGLMEQQRRRSLVVVLSNLRDEDHEDLDPALKMLRQRHLVVLADLRESLAEDDQTHQASAVQRARPFDQALLAAGQTLYRQQRRLATRQLRQHGVIHLDIEPAQLPGVLVSQYRQLKASGMF